MLSFPVSNSYPDPLLSLSLLAWEPYIMSSPFMVKGRIYAQVTWRLSPLDKRRKAGEELAKTPVRYKLVIVLQFAF